MSTKRQEFLAGAADGIPIALGYIPLSFSFGVKAIAGNFPVLVPVIMSVLSFTGAAQVAAIEQMANHASLALIAVLTLVINLRYLVMGLSLNQRLRGMSFSKKPLIAFGMTDEVFSVAMLRKEPITFPYYLGLMSVAYAGWVLGTLVGSLVVGFLPEILREALSITIYAMFAALFIPASKKNRAVLTVVLIAVGIACLFRFVPFLAALPAGLNIIVPTVVAAAVGALLFPVKQSSGEPPENGSRGGDVPDAIQIEACAGRETDAAAPQTLPESGEGAQ